LHKGRQVRKCPQANWSLQAGAVVRSEHVLRSLLVDAEAADGGCSLKKAAVEVRALD
jgi:hypothetical protein